MRKDVVLADYTGRGQPGLRRGFSDQCFGYPQSVKSGRGKWPALHARAALTTTSSRAECCDPARRIRSISRQFAKRVARLPPEFAPNVLNVEVLFAARAGDRVEYVVLDVGPGQSQVTSFPKIVATH